MALREQTENWEISFAREGASAHREFICDSWENAPWEAPKPGYPHPLYPALTVSKVVFRGHGKPSIGAWGARWEQARIIVDYSLEYRKPHLDDPPRVTWEYSAEVLNTAAGRKWADTGTTIDVEDLADAQSYSLMTCTVDCALREIPHQAIESLTNHLNATDWTLVDGPVTLLSVPAKMLMFQGAETSGQYDYDTAAWYYRVAYKFLWRPRSHNEIWRPPMRKWDAAAGDWARYQGSNVNGDYYTNDPVKVGHYVYQDGPTGVGAWVETDPVLYAADGDFSLLFP